MSHQEYTHLLEYLEERFTAIDSRFDRVDRRLDSLELAVDRILKWIARSDDELKISTHRINNIEGWIKKPLQD